MLVLKSLLNCGEDFKHSRAAGREVSIPTIGGWRAENVLY